MYYYYVLYWENIEKMRTKYCSPTLEMATQDEITVVLEFSAGCARAYNNKRQRSQKSTSLAACEMDSS